MLCRAEEASRLTTALAEKRSTDGLLLDCLLTMHYTQHAAHRIAMSSSA